MQMLVEHRMPNDINIVSPVSPATATTASPTTSTSTATATATATATVNANATTITSMSSSNSPTNSTFKSTTKRKRSESLTISSFDHFLSASAPVPVTSSFTNRGPLLQLPSALETNVSRQALAAGATTGTSDTCSTTTTNANANATIRASTKPRASPSPPPSGLSTNDSKAISVPRRRMENKTRSPGRLSPSSTASSTAALENKICQWYCCSCGQSYGSVLYKDNNTNLQRSNSLNEECTESSINSTVANNTSQNLNTAANTTTSNLGSSNSSAAAAATSSSSSSSNYVFDNLRYYSSVVFQDHKHVIMNSPKLQKAEGYFDHRSTQSQISYNSAAIRNADGNVQTNSTTPCTSHTNLTHLDTTCPESPTIKPHTPILSPLHLDLNNSSTGLIEYQDRVILNTPSRFTCHRCDHMMCPYCLKLRFKDLDI
ncbi:hypothetical protein PVL30_002312 [Lodderomyces elongisporus]|uniref:uncharacterized protein n=1 Tax=Lodderomyces elongisporus TaxID=36914 RepID=UPI00291CB710|nr:uncharacterized protein PVL30_002312 [Lodderomyces elongisporus]WLF78572.1 hypothetical protein PVL30_002312 [Lodderomyces elongisporus]